MKGILNIYKNHKTNKLDINGAAKTEEYIRLSKDTKKNNSMMEDMLKFVAQNPVVKTKEVAKHCDCGFHITSIYLRILEDRNKVISHIVDSNNGKGWSIKNEP